MTLTLFCFLFFEYFISVLGLVQSKEKVEKAILQLKNLLNKSKVIKETSE